MIREFLCGPDKLTSLRHFKVNMNRIMQLLSRSARFPFRFSCRVQHFHTQQKKLAVELTRIRYPNLKRGPYANICDADISNFGKLLPGQGRVITDVTELEGYNTDWLKTCRGSSQVVLRPKTTEEVSALLRYCNDRRLAVVPQGGNTGLVGGSVPVFDEVIISTQLMNNIISIDDVSGILVCQAGCILANVDSYLKDHNFTMPLDLGAKGSCHIGGNLATNAGGVRLLRYGSLHGSILGLEVVQANGEVIDCLSTLRKDNTGYDLKQLFIGSEGTLGIITKAAILCPQKPNAVNVAFLGCDSFNRVLDVFQKSKHMLGEILSAFEFMDSASMDVIKNNLKMPNPIADFPFYILIETSGSQGSHDEEKLNTFLETMLSSQLIKDGTVATDLSRIEAVWSVRERMAEGLMHDGYCYKYDVSLPLLKFYNLVEDMRHHLGNQVTRVVGYGHVGDGNLHLNITTPAYSHEIMDLIEPYVYDWVAHHHGSISAEHGLGLKKKQFIYHSKTKSAVRLMQAIKKLMDPNGILNPYKTIPS